MLFFYQFGQGQETTYGKTSIIVDSIPFHLTKHNNISIKAILNKTDTLQLMFHTATESVTLIEESVKKINSIIWNSEYDVKSWGGNTSTRYSETNFIQIGKLKWDSIALWENKNSGPKTDGKFGPNLFKGKVMEIDFDTNLIMLHTSLPSKTREYERLDLLNQDGNMFIVLESIVGKKNYPNRFLIHSGYGGTILYDDEFVENSKIGGALEVIEESQLKDSYGNILKTKKAILPLLKIGSTELKNIPIGFFEGTVSRQKMSVLGGGLLKRFNIIIDADRKHIYLKRNHLTNFEFSKKLN
tara:strand:- start:3452 stop:4348 length:897 start_codon:yes stop_codon:yes gene_type:complete